MSSAVNEELYHRFFTIATIYYIVLSRFHNSTKFYHRQVPTKRTKISLI